jgi:hypothetical protein
VGDALFAPIFVAYEAADWCRDLCERHEWLVPLGLVIVAVLA